MSTVLELKNVSKKLGGRKVLDNVSFTVNEGEIFGFLGPNGAGKTTTIKMIVGLLSVDEGEIFINGKSIKHNFETAMRMVGGIIENPEMYDYISGRKNLEIFGRMYGKISKQRYEEVIAQVKLSERINDKVKKYSLGMRQRLGVAQALLHKPKLLILDEPTNGLDPAGIKELRDNLRALARTEGLAVLVSSHLLSEMELMCDRFGIIDKGILTGTKSLTDIRENTIEGIVSYTFEVDNRTEAANIIYTYLRQPQPESLDKYIKIDITKDEAAMINENLVKSGIKVYAMSQNIHSLEDEFLALTADRFESNISGEGEKI